MSRLRTLALGGLAALVFSQPAAAQAPQTLEDFGVQFVRDEYGVLVKQALMVHNPAAAFRFNPLGSAMVTVADSTLSGTYTIYVQSIGLSLPPEERAAVINHELNHVVFGRLETPYLRSTENIRSPFLTVANELYAYAETADAFHKGQLPQSREWNAQTGMMYVYGEIAKGMLGIEDITEQEQSLMHRMVGLYTSVAAQSPFSMDRYNQEELLAVGEGIMKNLGIGR